VRGFYHQYFCKAYRDKDETSVGICEGVKGAKYSVQQNFLAKDSNTTRIFVGIIQNS